MRIRVLAILVAGAAGAIAQDLPRAKWIENGLIDAGGNHEPTIFVVRRGGQRLDAHEQNELAESEDALRRLKAQGIEVFHTHFYKGFGIAAERPKMEQTRHVAEIAHRLGLKIDTYNQRNVQLSTILIEQALIQGRIPFDLIFDEHLVNYNARKTPALEPVEVTCRVPAGQSAKGIRIYSPDAAEPQTLAMKGDRSKVSFAVPMKTYSVVVIEW
jgi:hypothetical protein